MELITGIREYRTPARLTEEHSSDLTEFTGLGRLPRENTPRQIVRNWRVTPLHRPSAKSLEALQSDYRRLEIRLDRTEKVV